MVKHCAYCNDPILKLGHIGQKVVEQDGQIWHYKCWKSYSSPPRSPHHASPRSNESRADNPVGCVNDGTERGDEGYDQDDIYYDEDGYETVMNFDPPSKKEVRLPKPQGGSQTLLADRYPVPDVCCTGTSNIAGNGDRQVANKCSTMNTSDEEDELPYEEVYQLFDRKTYLNHERRKFTDVVLSSDITRWKFLSIHEDKRSEGVDAGHITIKIGYSDEPFDIPLLKKGNTLLYKAVIHLLPHEAFFEIPVIIGIDLPTHMLSEDLANRISIYYSSTDLGESPHWIPFIKTKTDDSLDVHFEEDHASYGKHNRAKTSIKSAQVVLVLHHFCMFAVIVDKPVVKEKLRTLVSVCAKLRVDDSAYNVDVIVLTGCDRTAMATEELFVLGTNGYLKVESYRFHSLRDEGDMEIRLSRNDVHWMKDAKITDQQKYVYHAIDILAGVTKSAFTVRSLDAVRCGVESQCMFNVNITQIGRRPVVVKVSQDLHNLVSAGTVLPHCNCSRCSHSRSQSAESPCYAETDEYEYASMDRPPPVPSRQSTFTSPFGMASTLPHSSSSDTPRRKKGNMMHIYANLEGRQ